MVDHEFSLLSLQLVNEWDPENTPLKITALGAIWLLLNSFFLFFFSQPLDAKEQKDVLIVYSQDKWHPAHDLTEKGFRAVLDQKAVFDVQLHAEYLDLAHFPSPVQQKVTADFLRKKYERLGIDSIVTVYDLALNFVLNGDDPLFPGVPIIASELPLQTSKNVDATPYRSFITGTTEGGNMSGLMKDIFRMKPQTRHIALICGSSISDLDTETIFRKEIQPYLDKTDLIDLSQLSLEEILKRVASLPPETVILYGTLFMDSTGTSYVPREIIPRISTKANAPVFGLYDSYLGFGIVGGHLISFEELGKETARLLLRVLKGVDPEAIPWSGEDAYIEAYDWRELQRWSIPSSTLTAESQILYYTPSFWENYKWLVIAATGVICIEFALIFGLTINFVRRRQAERNLRDTEEQLRLAIDASGIGFWSLNIRTGQIWATAKFKSLHGIDIEEQVTYDRLLFHVVHQDDREILITFINQALLSNTDNKGEWRLVLPDGSTRWIAVYGKTSHNHSDQAFIFLKGACVDITANKQAEISLRNHKLELENLAGRLIHNQEEELRRLASSLHDDLTQRMAALVIEIGLVTNISPQLPALPILEDIKKKLSDISSDVHNLSRRLHPRILADLGIAKAVLMECGAFEKRTRIQLMHSIDEPRSPLPFSIELCLYRVLQESLQNMLKHSYANAGYVSITIYQDAVYLAVQDFGIGFDMIQPHGNGIGLSSMRERVHLVNGTFVIDSIPGEGTLVSTCIPLPGDAHVANKDTTSR